MKRKWTGLLRHPCELRWTTHTERGGVERASSSGYFVLLTSMIFWSRLSVNLRWMFEKRCYIYLKMILFIRLAGSKGWKVFHLYLKPLFLKKSNMVDGSNIRLIDWLIGVINFITPYTSPYLTFVTSLRARLV